MHEIIYKHAIKWKKRQKFKPRRLEMFCISHESYCPNPLVGEELYTQMDFLFRQFWPIDIFIVES